MIDRILWCCSFNSIKTWLYNWHNLKYAWCMVRLDTQVQLLLSGRDMLFSPHTVSRCHVNSQAKRAHLERKTISLASCSGKHRKTHNLGSGFFYNFGFGLKSSHGFMHPVFYFWLVQTSRTLRVGGEPRCLSALLCIARIPDFKRVVLPGVALFWSVFFLLWKVLSSDFFEFLPFLRIGMGWRKNQRIEGLALDY